MQTKFTDSGSNTDAFCKLQILTTKFMRMVFTIFLLVETVLSCESPLTESLLT